MVFFDLELKLSLKEMKPRISKVNEIKSCNTVKCKVLKKALPKQLRLSVFIV